MTVDGGTRGVVAASRGNRPEAAGKAGSLATFTWMDRALRPRAPHSATGQHRAGLGKLERGAT
jgi:hypothetical protein